MVQKIQQFKVGRQCSEMQHFCTAGSELQHASALLVSRRGIYFAFTAGDKRVNVHSYIYMLTSHKHMDMYTMHTHRQTHIPKLTSTTATKNEAIRTQTALYPIQINIGTNMQSLSTQLSTANNLLKKFLFKQFHTMSV